jgi:hypothetical protein
VFLSYGSVKCRLWKSVFENTRPVVLLACNVLSGCCLFGSQFVRADKNGNVYSNYKCSAAMYTSTTRRTLLNQQRVGHALVNFSLKVVSTNWCTLQGYSDFAGDIALLPRGGKVMAGSVLCRCALQPLMEPCSQVLVLSQDSDENFRGALGLTLHIG